MSRGAYRAEAFGDVAGCLDLSDGRAVHRRRWLMSSLLAGSTGTDALGSSDDPRTVRLLTAEGARLHGGEYERHVAHLSREQLLAMYEDMVVVRRIDTEATALQRQGELALWPPLLGQ